MKIRASKDVVVCIEVMPNELRDMADRLEKGGMLNEVIHVIGNVTPKETIDLRFMLPLSEKVKRAKERTT